MPIGLQRLNALPSQHPTPNIVFIKPLPGPSSSHSHNFLSRLAALCHPILTKHHLSVTSLEEFPANREFLGRNFNAGECIQLVLRTRSGGWMGFRQVAMVMMHELAHCVQMNHAKVFWQVRNLYAAELKALWARGYEGEGFWARGRALEGVEMESQGVAEEELPQEVCGGVYRGRRRRRGGRKRKEKVSYQEQKRRRIERKFGVRGEQLGEDEATRSQLLRGKKGNVYSKPRVAQSQRGRELRAQAALARLGQAETKKEVVEGGQRRLEFKEQQQQQQQDEGVEAKHEDDEEEVDDESEAGFDNAEDDITDEEDPSAPTAKDGAGATIRDQAGRDLVRVCPAEEGDDTLVKSERDELQGLWNIPAAKADNDNDAKPANRSRDEDKKGSVKERNVSQHKTAEAATAAEKTTTEKKRALTPASSTLSSSCPVCSLTNPALNLTCEACSCVLQPDKAPGHWRCRSTICRDGAYINSGDSRVCGVCGASRP